MPDPKLQLAAEEIRQILKKHDIAATCMLASTTHGEFLAHLDPSWSAVHYDEATGSLRMKCKLADFPSQEAFHERMEQSIGMLTLIADMIMATMRGVRALLAGAIASGVEIEGENRREQVNPGN